MAPDTSKKSTAYTLPISVVEPLDVHRLQREIEELDEFLRQAAIRKSGTATVLPRTSHMLSEFAELNKLNLLQTPDRQSAADFLSAVYKRAPVLHISFATDPSQAFITKIMQWLRQNIHHEVLMQIGLQPTIAAGCIVRTTNKQFDFSLRQRFLAKRDFLIKELDASNKS